MTFRTRLARIGYALGMALAVTAIVYFFSSNWGDFARGTKTLLAVCLTAVLYGLAFLPARLSLWRKHGDFLPLVFLFAGIWAFGATVALLNQIYNAYPDEWWLFSIWFVPALLFSLVLGNVWFYALAYGIGHLALWFTFEPFFGRLSDWQQAGVVALFGAVNLLLYVLADRGSWRAGFLKPVALGAFLFTAVWLSNSFVFDDVGRLLNLLSVPVLAACFYVFNRRRDSLALSLTGLAASFFAVLKFLGLMELYYSEWFFFFALVFVVLLLTGNVFFFRFVARLGTSGRPDGSGAGSGSDAVKTEAPGAAETVPGTPEVQATEAGDAEAAGTAAFPQEAAKADFAATGGKGPASASSASDSGTTAARVVSTIVTVVGTVIGTVSLVGLLMLFGDAWSQPETVVFSVGVLLAAVMAFLPGLHGTVRNTGIMVGLLTANFSIFIHEEMWVSLAVLALGVLAWIRLQGTAAKLAAHFILQLTFVFLTLVHLDWHGRDAAWILVVLAAANALAYGLRGWVRSPDHRRPLEIGSLVFMLVTLFWLTFLEDVFTRSHVLFNVVYFIVVSGLLVRSVRRRQNAQMLLFMAFWFFFIGFKYYDWLWDLLHKSLTLLAGGLVLIAASALLDRSADRREAASVHAREHAGGVPNKLLPYRRLAAVLLIIALQFAYIGGEIIAKESQFAGGTTVKLAIHPDEWQHWQIGHTTWVRYTISDLPEPMAVHLRGSGLEAGERIKLVLAPDAAGVHQIDRLYREGEAVRSGEVVINGYFDGWEGVRYGIENLGGLVKKGEPVPTSRLVEVRIGANGNAILKGWAAK